MQSCVHAHCAWNSVTEHGEESFSWVGGAGPIVRLRAGVNYEKCDGGNGGA